MALLVPVLLMVVLLQLPRPTDPDYWWHARTGALILETGALPTADPFSFTRPGAPWVPHEWLTQVLVAAVERWVGYVGNVALFGTLGALTVLLVYATCRARGAGDGTALLLALVFLPLGGLSLNVRPQVVTVVLVAATALVLTLARVEPRRYGVLPLLALPPLFAGWVNLHGGYVSGLLLLGAAVAGATVEHWLGCARQPLRPLLAASALSLGCHRTGKGGHRWTG